MIFDALLDWIQGTAEALATKLKGLIPPVPSWVSDGPAMIGTVLGYATSLGNWVAVPLFAVVVGSVVVCLVAGLSIKLARIIASFLTIGGGSAG